MVAFYHLILPNFCVRILGSIIAVAGNFAHLQKNYRATSPHLWGEFALAEMTQLANTLGARWRVSSIVANEQNALACRDAFLRLRFADV
jgi:hypothetical protein